MRLLRLLPILLAIACSWSARAAEEARNYPLGPIGGQYRISGGESYARVVSLTNGAPGAAAGLQTGDLILGAFGKPFTPTGSYHYGVSQDLGFAVDRAEGNGGQLPLQLLRPGVGGLNLTVNLPADGAFGPAYPRNDAKSAQLFESACAWLHTKTMSGNGNMGYFTGWTGLSLLGHPNWNSTTGPKPYRLSVNKIRDFVVGQINNAAYSPVEDKLIDGSANPNYATQTNTMSNWELGQKVMFLAEYYAKTSDASVAATLQRGVEICANTVQWWKQPALAGNGYSPGYAEIAGIVAHGGVTGDYIHLGWGGGINMVGVYSFNGMAFGRSAGMNMAAQPRDGHYFGYAQCPPGVVPVGMENKDHSIDEKFLMQTNWMINRTGYFPSSDPEIGHVNYTLGQGDSSWDAGGRTPATLLGMALYKRDGGTFNASDTTKLERLKGYVSKKYMQHQEAHAYCVGAQAYQQFATAFLSDRQQRFFMENWRFYYALAQTPDGGFQYFRARSVNDNYLDETHCAALNAALPYAIANGGISLIPAYKSDRLIARFDNPEITWPTLDARKVTLTGSGTLAMPVAIVDGDGTPLTPAEYSLSWTKISGPGTVTFNSSSIDFSQSGDYRVQMTATRGAQSVVEPIIVSVGLFNPPPGYVAGKADYQVYTGIPGKAVADLTNAAKFPNSPDIVRTVTRAAGDFSGDNYGARLSGAIIPPTTGSYRFYIAADDRARLSLNPNGMNPAAATIVASLDNWDNWTGVDQWDKYPSQKSVAINLTAGQAIWFEALQKEGDYGDHLSVGWSINGGPIEVLPGASLAAVSTQAATMSIVSHPAPTSAAPGDTVTLSVTTTGPTPAIYQWRRNGSPLGLPGSSATLTLSNVSGGAEGDYDVIYTTPAGTLASNPTHVTITGTGEIATGGLWREVYTDIGGSSVANLTSNSKFPNFSDSSGPIASATSPTNYADSYGERWTGWITPAVTGNYRFYLASDDDSELWLSTNELPASATRILNLAGYSNEKQWSARSPSAYFPMTAGLRYYLQVLHKEGASGDHCAVAWQRQGTSTPTNGSGEIPASVLSYRNGGIYNDIPFQNLAPTFSINPVIGVNGFDGTAYSGTLTGSASDPDTGDTLTYSRISGPAWLVVATDGALSGNPVTANLGLNSFIVRVTDSGGLWDEATLEIQVGAANAPPVFAADPLNFPTATALAAYTGHSLAASATDGDSDPLTFTKLSGPAWLSVASNGTLSGTPAIGDIGANAFTLRVNDPTGGQDLADLNIVVSEPYFLYDINGATAGSGAAAGGTWNGTAQWTTDPDGSGATIAWINGAMPVFSAGTDATGSYSINNTTVRAINGFVARTGTPRVIGSALEVLSAGSPFIVEANALGARIDVTLSGTGGIVKSGPGTLILGGNSTYLGNTTITEGVLELTPAAKLYNNEWNNTAVVTIATGGTWRLPDYSYDGVGKHADYRQRRVLDGGTIEVTGASHTSGQDFTVYPTGGVFRYTPVGQTLTLTGNTNTNIQTTGTLTFDTIGNITVSGTSSLLTGVGAIVKTGAGDLTLANGGNTFIGSLTVNAGKLLATAASVGPNTAIGTKLGGRIVAVNAPATMEWTANNILGSSGMAATGLPTITLNGSTLKTTQFNTIGNATLNGGSLVNAYAAGSALYDGFQFIGTVTATGTAPSAITTTITGRGNHLLGGGTTEFSVADPAGLLTVSTLLRNGSTDYSGTGSLLKTGPGTLTLTAANVFTGTTTVNAGTLALTGNLTSATTVADTGKLSGSGSVTAAVSVQSGGTLAPDTAATLTTGALTLASGSTLLADGDTAVTGNVDVTGAKLVVTTAPAASPRVLLTFTGSRTGSFNEATSTLPAGWKIEYDDVAFEIRLVTAAADYTSWIDGFTTNGQSGFTDDANNDGISNGLVFLLGGDPLVHGSTALPVFEKLPAGGFRYSFTRAARARGHSTVIAKLSDDLLTWPTARDIVIGTSSSGVVTITDEIDHDAITIEIPASAPRTFIRLEVTEPSSP
jgi:autotransporter-associated beta strand protein